MGDFPPLSLARIDSKSTSRQDGPMKHESKTGLAEKGSSPSRQIVGFSLPPDLAVEVKIEAAKRGISLRKLFGEMWALYKNENVRVRVNAGQSR